MYQLILQRHTQNAITLFFICSLQTACLMFVTWQNLIIDNMNVYIFHRYIKRLFFVAMVLNSCQKSAFCRPSLQKIEISCRDAMTQCNALYVQSPHFQYFTNILIRP